MFSILFRSVRRLKMCGVLTVAWWSSPLSISFIDFWLDFIEVLNSQELNEIVVQAYFIWQMRNDFVYNSKFVHPSNLYPKAKFELTLIWQQTSPSDVVNCNLHHSSSNIIWQHPPPLMPKVNWDATLYTEKNITGIGVLIHNHKSHFVGALRASRPLVQNAFIA